jgi:predicted N-formylglutamate amidohydrolase
MLLEALGREPALVLGDNQPYQVTPTTDYGIPVYAEGAGRPGVLIEVRQDLLTTSSDAERWGDRLAATYLAVEAVLFG